MQNAMQLQPAPARSFQIDSRRYAKCVEISKRVSWDIDRDVIRGRTFDTSKKFLPDGLSSLKDLEFLDDSQRRLFSHIQGRTYANMFGMIERFIGAKMLQVTEAHWLGDQTALEALVRFTDEELKHQELFRRIERLIGSTMPGGYRFVPAANEVSAFVLGKSTWAVLALTCMIEIVTQAHYRESIALDRDLSELYKDVFLFHWKEESQHAILDELEWRREDARLSNEKRDAGVNDLIALAAAVDGLVQQQAHADSNYFLALTDRRFSANKEARVRTTMLRAYRWQYILSGAQEERFAELLGEMITEQQGARIAAALAPLSEHASVI